MSDPVAAAVAAAHRDHWPRVLAATVRVVRDLDLAEDAVQDAYADALAQWGSGLPDNPAAWLTTTARRRALDRLRRDATLRSKLPLLWTDSSVSAPADETSQPSVCELVVETGTSVPVPEPETSGRPRQARTTKRNTDEARNSVSELVEATPDRGEPGQRVEDEDEAVVLDEQLRLIFLCAHPALAPEARVALTLRLVCGVETPDISAAFLVKEATMAARLTRAKRKIVLSRIPCRVPDATQLPSRVTDVLDTVSVLLATGHAAPSGAQVERREVLDAGIRLLETLVRLLPEQTEPRGLLAQALLLGARVTTRVDDAGRPVPLAEQDRRRWDRPRIERADALVASALADGGRGPYVLQAAIAALQCVPDEHRDIDWAEVLTFYNLLLDAWDTPLVRLNRAVVVAELGDVEAALAQVDALVPALADYRYLHATRADLLTRLGRPDEAIAAYRSALACGGSDPERELLQARADALIGVSRP